MNNKKKLTIILAVLAVVCVFAVLVFSGVIKIGGLGGEEESTGYDSNYSFDESAYQSGVKLSATTDAPYLETGIDGIFYSMTTDGAVSFFKYADNAFSEVSATGTYDVTVVMSEQDISATITYIKDGDSVEGYGLYTGTEGEYNLYPYAFFRLTSFGADYSGADSDSALLLVDTTSDDFYSNSKIYEEPFTFYFDDSSSERLLSEANRTVGLDGTKRADYSMINDSVIEGSWDKMLFFSGRHYAEGDGKIDLLRSGGSGNNTDNVLVASDVLGYWATYVKGGIEYITVDDSENVIIEKYVLDSESTETVKTFEGIKRDDILVSDGYVYVVSTNTLYSIADDSEITLASDKTEGFKADSIAVSDDSFVLRGYVDKMFPTVISAKTTDGSVNWMYTNNMFKDAVNPFVLTDGKAIVTVLSQDKFTYYIF